MDVDIEKRRKLDNEIQKRRFDLGRGVTISEQGTSTNPVIKFNIPNPNGGCNTVEAEFEFNAEINDWCCTRDWKD